MMRASGRCSNLRAALADDEGVRKTVQETVKTMDKVDGEDIRGFRRANLLDPTLPEYYVSSKLQPCQLPSEVHRLLCELIEYRVGASPDVVFPMKALSSVEISLHGVSYGIAQSSRFRDSTVLFRSYNSQTLKAGVINTIFQYVYSGEGGHPVQAFYVTLSEYPPAKPTLIDPYLKFPISGGFLCEAKTKQLHVVQLSQIVSHFAITKMNAEWAQFIHAMPLDRVSHTVG